MKMKMNRLNIFHRIRILSQRKIRKAQSVYKIREKRREKHWVFASSSLHHHLCLLLVPRTPSQNKEKDSSIFLSLFITQGNAMLLIIILPALPIRCSCPFSPLIFPAYTPDSRPITAKQGLMRRGSSNSHLPRKVPRKERWAGWRGKKGEGGPKNV